MRYWLVSIAIVAALAARGMAQDVVISPHLAEQAFTKFAAGWLGKLSREAPTPGNAVRFLGPQEPGQTESFTYRDYGEDFAVQTKPTGDAEAPFVGILSYTENVYVCRGPTRNDCELVESSPITEIFPFRDGHWRY